MKRRVEDSVKYLTPEALKDPEVRGAALSLLNSSILDIDETKGKRNDLVDLLEPDDFEGYEELQREIDEVFYSGLL